MRRLRLCSSYMSGAFLLIVSSLCVLAFCTRITLPKSSKPSISSTASKQDFSLLKTMNAWPLRLRLLLATISMISP